MPAELVYDIFAVRGVRPQWLPKIRTGNAILRENHPAIQVTMRLGKIDWLTDRDGVGNRREVGAGAMAAGGTTNRDYRYAADTRAVMNHRQVRPEPGHMPIVWVEQFTGHAAGGLAVNPAVWDSTYTGRSGIILSNESAENCILHETLHMVGIQHCRPPDPNRVIDGAATGGRVVTQAEKQALRNATF